ncbi:YfiR family protein [Acinetobacter wuhouensis]|uniref:YfiR family protein n=1 Tax=Acinetobacter wuhouensis TaxID=1879050 RepID=A0A4Q7ADC4_9GAMM|nr:YfiR family protein [Acinetobacter wuhouensis]RZG43706.1 YfiR family protein [Acinetobacter wuhouensis]
MVHLINRKAFCLGVLLFCSNYSLADSSHNIFTMTLSILSYAKLKNPNPELCVVDNPTYANQFSSYIKPNKSLFNVNAIHSSELKNQHCDAVFFSNTSAQTEQLLINKSLNPLILSFSSSNLECEIGSVFCLSTNKAGNTIFKVNLDSLAQSKVHIDPRVLLLAKNSG